MGIITSILKRPSQRTQYEATLAGTGVLTITSLITPIYLIFFSDASIWIKIASGLGGIGLFLIMFSSLSMTYLQYYSFKMGMDMYEPSQKLLIKIDEAKRIRKELADLIKLNGGEKC